MQKRKSASQLFKEQNIISNEEILEEQPEIPLPEQDVIDPGAEQVIMQTSNTGLNLSATKANIPNTSYKEKPSYYSLPDIKSSEEMQLEKEPIKIRITGKLFWKRVIVPPNAYVIHTRINRKKPVTLGMGASFKYNPNTDAFMVIPAAMQTIGVVANCISKEKQGINILAYVQWQIDDFSLAYKKLDFSDSRDPLGIVNAQLREQAEAAIKDKIATMSVEEVLTDKEPVIEELTERLKSVAEGQKNADIQSEGLGIKIITVQIREAYVCSASLWKDLQSPFRYEQQKKARISYLDMITEIKTRELEAKKHNETKETETNLEIEQIKQKKQTEAHELKLKEEEVRYAKEQENLQNKLKMEEETVILKKITDDRILAKENELQLKREIEILNQQNKKNAEEERLEVDADRRKNELDIDKKIFNITLNEKLNKTVHRLNETEIAMKKIIKTKKAELASIIQKQKYEIEKLIAKSKQEIKIEQHKNEIKLQEENNNLIINFEEKKLNIEKIKKEIENLINDKAIFSQLVARLPEIAKELPEVKELNVVQSGDNDYIINTFANFINKFLLIAKSLGIKIPDALDKKED